MINLEDFFREIERREEEQILNRTRKIRVIRNPRRILSEEISELSERGEGIASEEYLTIDFLDCGHIATLEGIEKGWIARCPSCFSIVCKNCLKECSDCGRVICLSQRRCAQRIKTSKGVRLICLRCLKMKILWILGIAGFFSAIFVIALWFF
jgi:hypothetical protein